MLKTSVGVMVGFKALFAIGSGLVIALLGPFALSQVASISRTQGVAVGAFVAPFLSHPWLVSVLCVPAIGAGAWALLDQRHRWLALAVSTLFLLLSVGVVLLALLTVLQTLYQSAGM